jgi:hypothetical protein
MKVLIFLVVLFGLGVIAGNRTASPGVDFVKVPITKTVHDPAPPAEVIYKLPPACQDALDAAFVVDTQANIIYDSGTEQLDILTDARIAFAGHGNLTKVQEDQQDLLSSTVGALGDMEEAFASYQGFMKDCEAEK